MDQIRAALVYFSRGGMSMWFTGTAVRQPGNTERLMQLVKDELERGGACATLDTYRILPADPYPEDVDEAKTRNFAEQDDHAMPEIAEPVPSLADYDVIVLGFPVWGDSVPRIISSYLSQASVGESLILPFVTWSLSPLCVNITGTIALVAPDATVGLPMYIRGEDVERERTLEHVHEWLESADLAS
ncbi:flavodoxin [Actinobaculum suis]|uniref:flavodoxin n=1 Tax=Actinobaculum suis TaxID=1657 RepID=UPI0008087DA3|nr:flavodoxin [Actinobaculum suis]OCA95051.1 hypothetical protein ACU20_04475 [Actinobaculum suis]OCA95765.1 hypothetical protein ACU21_03055 [Actinobaculum suis]